MKPRYLFFIVFIIAIAGGLFAYDYYNGNSAAKMKLRDTSFAQSEADEKSDKNNIPPLSDILEMGEQGLKTSDSKIIISYLEKAGDHGLSTIDLKPIKTTIESGKKLDDNQKQVLKDAALKYATELHGGRINWKNARLDWDMRPKTHDFVKDLDLAIETRMVEQWLKSLAPQHDAYLALMGARHLYDDLVKAGGFINIGHVGNLKLGDNNQNVALLRTRLNQEGYGAQNAANPTLFDDVLKSKLSLYQKSHGLKQTGEMNENTLAALSISAIQRLKQIDINLERERWVPRENPKTRIEANIATAHLIYFENGAPKLEMPTIVGATKSKTPMLASHVRGVVFNPPWYKPASIKGRVRVQPPGPRNALGRVKFDFANDHAVFLHDTPNHGLFAAQRRTLSHGCVRLHYPKDLAAILTAPNGYTRERIDEITTTTRTHYVKLTNKTPVLLLYRTAFVDYNSKEGGIVHFVTDVYDWDPILSNLIDGKVPDDAELGTNQAQEGRSIAAP